MLRDLLSVRVVLAVLVFFVLVVGGSLFYSWHVHRTIDAELAETQRKVQPLENKNEPHLAEDTVDTSTADFEQTETLLEVDDSQVMSDDAETSFIDNADEIETLANTSFIDGTVSMEKTLERFQDFKTTPEGFPLTPYWDYPEDRQANWSYDHKLVCHVLVKLWRQGVQNFEGGSIDGESGKVRPHYTNTLYVKMREILVDGEKRPFIETCIGPAGGWRKETPFDFPPPSVRLIDLNSTEGQGIDPYTFLTSEELP